MGLILGLSAILLGVFGVRYSVMAIVAGITAVLAFFGLKKE